MDTGDPPNDGVEGDGGMGQAPVVPDEDPSPSKESGTHVETETPHVDLVQVSDHKCNIDARLAEVKVRV